MDTKQKVIIGIVALAASFAAGRFATPEKVRVETKTVEVETKKTDTKTDLDLNKHKETVTTTTKKPDGTVETTTKTTEDSQAQKTRDTQTVDQDRKAASESKETTYSTSKLHLNALAGFSIHDLSTPVYGASISKDVIGPVSAGLWGLSNGTGGISVGLSL